MNDEELKKLIGDHAKEFSDKGIRFLGLRSRGRDTDLASKVINALASGKITKIPKTVRTETGKAFGDKVLTDAEITIILLGRPPVTANKEPHGIQESGKIWDAGSDQEKAAAVLADKVGLDNAYKNIRKGSGKTAKKEVEPATPATPADPKTEKKATPAKPAKPAASTKKKAPVKKTATKKKAPTKT